MNWFIFLAGFGIGCFVSVTVFLTLANWRKPEKFNWLEDMWKRQLESNNLRNQILQDIVNVIRNH